MKLFKGTALIGQLEKRKGGYYYIVIPARTVEKFPNQRQTRLLCSFGSKLTLRCGLNHLGDGNFFIIISTKNMKTLGKGAGDKVNFELVEDPDPLGVDLPESLQALLAQDRELKKKFDSFSVGKKRSVVHALNRIKDLDLQIERAVDYIANDSLPLPGRAKSSRGK